MVSNRLESSDCEKILSFVNLSWDDIYFAFENNIIDRDFIVTYAETIVDMYSNFDVYDIIINNESINIESLLFKFIEIDKYKEDDCKSKWLYILIKLIYNQNTNNSYLWERISYIYTTFNYPDEIKHLVYYMPSQHPISTLLFPRCAKRALLRQLLLYLKANEYRWQ